MKNERVARELVKLAKSLVGTDEQAAKMIDSSDSLVDNLKGYVMMLERASKRAKKDLDGLRKAGGGIIGAKSILSNMVPNIEKLARYADTAHKNAKKQSS